MQNGNQAKGFDVDRAITELLRQRDATDEALKALIELRGRSTRRGRPPRHVTAAKAAIAQGKRDRPKTAAASAD